MKNLLLLIFGIFFLASCETTSTSMDSSAHQTIQSDTLQVSKNHADYPKENNQGKSESGWVSF